MHQWYLNLEPHYLDCCCSGFNPRAMAAIDQTHSNHPHMSYCFSPLVIAVLVFSSADLKPKLMVQTGGYKLGQNRLQGFLQHHQWKRNTHPTFSWTSLVFHLTPLVMRLCGRALAPWRRCAALPLRLRRPLGRWAAAGLAVAVASRIEMPDYRCSENSQAPSICENQDLIFFASIGFRIG